MLESFVNEVLRVEDPAVGRVLKSPWDLFALSTIESPYRRSWAFSKIAYIFQNQLRQICSHIHHLLLVLVSELTDAWNFFLMPVCNLHLAARMAMSTRRCYPGHVRYL